ncbi:hypothetical protein [Geothrix oryzisoli]|uniref:hypothetical protein n=1 Tax=Geothrix oryzisoli TaxID=2922721 RepID=UPI001FAE0A1B|nr:hypothetical protein [Geothrix oryzisoli]
MTPTHKLLTGCALLALAGLLACGGGGGGSSAPATVTPATATSLSYTDPTSSTFLLRKNPALSTPTHLVLELVGPASATGSGVSASFTVDATKVAWVNVAASDPANTFVQNGTAFTLGASPQILLGRVASGTLQVTAAQKGTGSPVSLNAPLLRIALDLKASQTVGAVPFSADGTKCQVLDGTGTIGPMAVSVGTLAAQ